MEDTRIDIEIDQETIDSPSVIKSKILPVPSIAKNNAKKLLRNTERSTSISAIPAVMCMLSLIHI